MILFADLTELTQCRLEIVSLHRQVVVIRKAAGLMLLQPRLAARGVGAAVIHIVPRRVAAAAELYNCHRQYIHWKNVDASMITAHHAWADLASQVGVTGHIGFIVRLTAPKMLAGDCRIRAHTFEDEFLPIPSRHRFELAVPKSLGISTVKRE